VSESERINSPGGVQDTTLAGDLSVARPPSIKPALPMRSLRSEGRDIGRLGQCAFCGAFAPHLSDGTKVPLPKDLGLVSVVRCVKAEEKVFPKGREKSRWRARKCSVPRGLGSIS